MRIGIFSETYTPYISGLVTSEVMLKKALEKQGHEVYVITYPHKDIKDIDGIHVIGTKGLNIPGVRGLMFKMNAKKGPRRGAGGGNKVAPVGK